MQRKINKRKENSHKILFLSIVIKYQWQTREIYFSLKSFLPQLCSVVAESFHRSDPRRPRKAINKYEDCKFYNDDIVTLITLPTLKTKNYVLTMTHGDDNNNTDNITIRNHHRHHLDLRISRKLTRLIHGLHDGVCSMFDI